MQNYTYHCHTNFSDGKNTPEEMIKKAYELGFSEIGITDHLYLNKNIDYDLLKKFNWDHIYNHDFNEATQKAKEYCSAIKKAAANYPIKVLIGYEVDFFQGEAWLAALKKLKKDVGLDYLISGTHFGMDNDKPFYVTMIKDYTSDEILQKKFVVEHLQRVAAAAASGVFEFIAHIDFVRWSQVGTEFDFRDEKMAIVEALAKNKIPTEINTKGYRILGDFYPSKWLLEEMKIRKIPVVISDDAHSVDDIGSCFSEAEKMLEDMDYKYRFNLKHLIKENK